MTLTLNKGFWFPLGGGGGDDDDMIFISKATASSSASLEITSGIDSTYNQYKIVLNKVIAQTSAALLQMQFSTNGSTYAEIVGSAIYSSRNYTGVVSALAAETGQSRDATGSTPNTGMNDIGYWSSSDSADSLSGWIDLYNRANTSLNKLAYSSMVNFNNSLGPAQMVAPMVINQTSAITALKFSYTSGNIVSGDFILYGIKES